MNEQSLGCETAYVSRVAQDKSCDSLQANPDEVDQAVYFQEPIILDREEKEVFLKLVKRPAQVNKKLLLAFRKLQ